MRSLTQQIPAAQWRAWLNKVCQDHIWLGSKWDFMELQYKLDISYTVDALNLSIVTAVLQDIYWSSHAKDSSKSVLKQ